MKKKKEIKDKVKKAEENLFKKNKSSYHELNKEIDRKVLSGECPPQEPIIHWNDLLKFNEIDYGNIIIKSNTDTMEDLISILRRLIKLDKKKNSSYVN